MRFTAEFHVLFALSLRATNLNRNVSFIPGNDHTGWVIVFGRANHFSISPSHSDQLSLLTSGEREMSTDQSVIMLRGFGAKAEWFIPDVDKRVGDMQNCVMPP